MKFIVPYKNEKDSRGLFKGLINSGTWEEINFIETEAGITRGGHYHKDTVELFFILDGDIEVTISKTNSIERQKYPVSSGQIILIEPNEIHFFRCLTRCRWINVLSKKIDEIDPDFHREF